MPEKNWLDNLCRYWSAKGGMGPRRSQRLAEYLVEVLADRLDKPSWEAALAEAAGRVRDFYPEAGPAAPSGRGALVETDRKI